MRKGLEHKYDIHKLALEGLGVIVDAAAGAVYQLDVAPDGWCRLWKKALVLDGGSVVGKPLYIWDYGTPEKAIAQFESIKNTPGVTWCEDGQVDTKVLKKIGIPGQEHTDVEKNDRKEKANEKQKPAKTRRRGRPRAEQMTIDDLMN